jgi:hypothetical protein
MTTLTPRTGALAGLVLALLVAACGTSATPTADNTVPPTTEAAQPSQAVSPEDGGEAGGTLCDLAPIEQVELALGGTTDGGVADDSILTGGTTCRFTLDDEHVLDVSTSEQTRDEWFDAIETVGLTDEEVAGVGEEAYRAAGTALGGPGARFTAWADGREVGVTIYSDADQEVTFAAAEAIAQAVLAAED